MHRVIVFSARVIFGLENFCLARIANGNFGVEDAFESLGDVSTMLYILHTNLGKSSHVAVHLSVQVVLLGDLQRSELKHESRVSRQTIVDVLSIKVAVLALKGLAKLID